MKAEEIKVEYSPPTIDEEKIVESLKDRNRSKLYKIFKSGFKKLDRLCNYPKFLLLVIIVVIMKQISRADLEYDDLILFAKHFGILYRKLKGGMFGKELSLNAVACRVSVLAA